VFFPGTYIRKSLLCITAISVPAECLFAGKAYSIIRPNPAKMRDEMLEPMMYLYSGPD